MAQDDDFIIGGRKTRKSSSQGSPKPSTSKGGNASQPIVKLGSLSGGSMSFTKRLAKDMAQVSQLAKSILDQYVTVEECISTMSEKIISNNGELIFEFDNGLSFDALFVHALRAKFEGELSADILLPHPEAKAFLEAMLKHLKKTSPRAYDIKGIWNRTLDQKLNEKVTNFLVSYEDLIHWKKKTNIEKFGYLNDVFFPWVQPESIMQKMIDEIDQKVQ